MILTSARNPRWRPPSWISGGCQRHAMPEVGSGTIEKRDPENMGIAVAMCSRDMPVAVTCRQKNRYRPTRVSHRLFNRYGLESSTLDTAHDVYTFGAAHCQK